MNTIKIAVFFVFNVFLTLSGVSQDSKKAAAIIYV
jgi:hypothetical protein